MALAFQVWRADTPNTMGRRPSSSRSLSRTNSITCSTSARFSRMSILLTATTSFLPQSRIVSRKVRSLSVNGRSAEVTNSTSSERGTNSRVSASWPRTTAFVPGVSTTFISRRIPSGSVISS